VSAAGEDVQPGEDQWEAPEAHALSVDQLARRLGTNPVAGLSEQDARARLDGVGPNALEQEARTPYARIALRQFADPLVALLLGAVVVSLAVGERVDAIAIAVIVLLNGALGFSQELAAERALVGLRETVKRRAMVIREGRERELPSEALVPGDLMVLREGERVAADGRIVLAEGLPVQESLLTGESVPADKSARAVAVGVPLADRVSMVFAGTAVTRGRGLALVTATGSRAEIGQVAALTAAAAAPPTPLQRRLGGLTKVMVGAGVLIPIGLAAVRLAQGASAQSAFLLGVSVAVAAVPEGLAATVTIALALGARRMAARGAIRAAIAGGRDARQRDGDRIGQDRDVDREPAAAGSCGRRTGPRRGRGAARGGARVDRQAARRRRAVPGRGRPGRGSPAARRTRARDRAGSAARGP
jgi:Ca2+-transporting ATPase